MKSVFLVIWTFQTWRKKLNDDTEPPIVYDCKTFGKFAAKVDIPEGGFAIKEFVSGVLTEICLLSDLDIPDLEKEVE